MDLKDSLIRDRVGDLEISAAVSVSPGETIRDAITIMQRERIGCIIVQEGAALRGIFTERDILKRVLAEGTPLDRPVESVMTVRPDTLALKDTIGQVILKMNSGGYRHMPVVDEAGEVIGMLSVKRIVQYLAEHFPQAVYNLPPDPAAIATAREGS